MSDYEQAYVDVLREAMQYNADLFHEQLIDEARLDNVSEQ